MQAVSCAIIRALKLEYHRLVRTSTCREPVTYWHGMKMVPIMLKYLYTWRPGKSMRLQMPVTPMISDESDAVVSV